MTPKQELDFLKGFIKLDESQANKRDFLERFEQFPTKQHIIDADSLLFNVAYATIDDNFDGDIAVTKYLREVGNIEWYIEDALGVYIITTHHAFTTCKHNFRKGINKEYKANRKPTELTDRVRLVKKAVIEYLEMIEDSGLCTKVYYDDFFLEADDIVAELAHGYKHDCVMSAIDKDIKQLPVVHFDYKKVKTKDENGCDILIRVENEATGFMVEMPEKQYKGFMTTSEQEGYEMLLCHLLIGDSSDNIVGAKGIGAKKAVKLIKDKNNFGMLKAVAKAYGDFDRLRDNIKMIKL